MASAYPWYPWYPADWMSDPCVRKLTWQEQQIWRCLIDVIYLGNEGKVEGTVDELSHAIGLNDTHAMAVALVHLMTTGTADIVICGDQDRLASDSDFPHSSDDGDEGLIERLSKGDSKVIVKCRRVERELHLRKLHRKAVKRYKQRIRGDAWDMQGQSTHAKQSPTKIPSQEGHLASQEMSEPGPSLDEESNKQERIPYAKIVEYLNLKAKKQFRHTTPVTKSLIRARWNAGFRFDDFKTVIDKMCAKWLEDEKMNDYLRPQTLFGTKFEAYLNAKEDFRL